MRSKTLLPLLVILWLGIAHSRVLSQSLEASNSANVHHGESTSRGYLGLVLHADVPQYPSLALQARISGIVHIHVVVEDGIIVKTNSEGSAQLRMLLAAALENLKSWRFAPGIRGNFDVQYLYELSPDESIRPENPKIEMQMPDWVRVTAKPVKNTCQDCEPR